MSLQSYKGECIFMQQQASLCRAFASSTILTAYRPYAARYEKGDTSLARMYLPVCNGKLRLILLF